MNTLIYVKYHSNFPPDNLTGVTTFEALTFMLEGSADYYVDGRKYTVSAGDALYIPTGCQRVRYAQEEKTSYISINFVTDGVLPEIKSYFRLTQINEFIMLCIRMQQRFYSDPPEKKLCDAILEVLLLECASMCKNGEYSTHVERMKKYISEHYIESMRISDITACTGLTTSYGASLFRRVMGQSIGGYIDAVRFNTAKGMLENTLMPISEIAERMNFSSVYYFSRWFLKLSGERPSEYRKRLSPPAPTVT